MKNEYVRLSLGHFVHICRFLRAAFIIVYKTKQNAEFLVVRGMQQGGRVSSREG